MQNTNQQAAIEAIKKKLTGKSLSYHEIFSIMDEIASNRLGPVLTTYFAAAGFTEGFSDEELYYLTKARRRSSDSQTSKYIRPFEPLSNDNFLPPQSKGNFMKLKTLIVGLSATLLASTAFASGDHAGGHHSDAGAIGQPGNVVAAQTAPTRSASAMPMAAGAPLRAGTARRCAWPACSTRLPR